MGEGAGVLLLETEAHAKVTALPPTCTLPAPYLPPTCPPTCPLPTLYPPYPIPTEHLLHTYSTRSTCVLYSTPALPAYYSTLLYSTPHSKARGATIYCELAGFANPNPNPDPNPNQGAGRHYLLRAGWLRGYLRRAPHHHPPP